MTTKMLFLSTLSSLNGMSEKALLGLNLRVKTGYALSFPNYGAAESHPNRSSDL